MGVVNPIWLWGLTALTVPLVIHILSRRDVRVIMMGSVRHLYASSTRHAVRFQFHALALLLVRCLLLTVVCLLIAGLYHSGGSVPQRWLLVESGAISDPAAARLIDSLERSGYQKRVLRPGFPRWTPGDTVDQVVDYWNLTEALARIQPDRCVVVSHTRATGFAGQRPAPLPNVTWINLPVPPSNFVLSGRRAPGDSVMVRRGASSEWTTSFITQRMTAAEAQRLRVNDLTGTAQTPDSDASPDQLMIDETVTAPQSASFIPDPENGRGRLHVIVSSGEAVDKQQSDEQQIVMAALQAIQQESGVYLDIVEKQPGARDSADWLIWLSSDRPAINARAIIRPAPPESLQHAWIGTSLLTPATDRSTPGRDEWWITQRLTFSVAVREQFALQLAQVLLRDSANRLTRRLASRDVRAMPYSQLFSTSRSAVVGQANRNDDHQADASLAVVVLVLLAVERWMANRQQL